MMEEQRDPKKALEGKPGRRRKRGKPCTRWIDNVEDNLRKMKIKRWRSRTAGRREWRGIRETAKVLQGLQCHGGEVREFSMYKSRVCFLKSPLKTEELFKCL
jgi:hypothetical protein